MVPGACVSANGCQQPKRCLPSYLGSRDWLVSVQLVLGVNHWLHRVVCSPPPTRNPLISPSALCFFAVILVSSGFVSVFFNAKVGIAARRLTRAGGSTQIDAALCSSDGRCCFVNAMFFQACAVFFRTWRGQGLAAYGRSIRPALCP